MESNARTRSEWTQAVAAQIRAERAAADLTQRQVIDLSGIPKSTYLRMESGERVADADQLAKFATALGVRLSVFFKRVEERVAAPSGSEDAQPTPSLAEHIVSQLSPDAQEQVRQAQRTVAKGAARRRSTGQ